MTLFWLQSGPLIRYADGFLHVEDLNPQTQTKWRMTRTEMLKTGLRFIWASFRARP